MSEYEGWRQCRHHHKCTCGSHVLLLFFSAESDTRKSVGSDKMRAIVRRLCSRDPHQFFQRLETLAR